MHIDSLIHVKPESIKRTTYVNLGTSLGYVWGYTEFVDFRKSLMHNYGVCLYN